MNKHGLNIQDSELVAVYKMLRRIGPHERFGPGVIATNTDLPSAKVKSILAALCVGKGHAYVSRYTKYKSNQYVLNMAGLAYIKSELESYG